MKKCKSFLISNVTKQIHEGGMARNFAFIKEFGRRDFKVIAFYHMNLFYRLYAFVRNLGFLLWIRNSKIVILQNTLITYIFPLVLFRYDFLVSLIRKILIHSEKYNRIYIEINDLIHIQSLDLQLPVPNSALKYENLIFSVPGLEYIFASGRMRDYIVEKYNIPFTKTQVVINGAPQVSEISITKDNFIDHDRPLRFLYVGTLNKGRDIEKLIEVFSKSKNELYLMGKGGEWMNLDGKANIFNLGSFTEEQALLKASEYDLGVIPYDNDKFYYNLCYPTKVSFYLAAGLPILCTPLQETKKVLEKCKREVAIFSELKNWTNVINDLSISQCVTLKDNVNHIKEQFYWENVFLELKTSCL